MLERQIQKIKSNAPFLLSGTSVIGVVTTAYLAARATASAVRKIDADEKEHGEVAEDQRLKYHFKLVWKDYIPPTISGVVTIGCIIGNTKVNQRRTAAAQAAFVLGERAFSEYREHVIEELGEKKEQAIRDKVVSDRVQENPPGQIIITDGDVLCCEHMTGRYFTSSMEKLRRAQNQLNANIIKYDFQTLNDWYDLIGLDSTSISSYLGWTSGRSVELQFTSTIAPNGKPCLVFDYNLMPASTT